MNIEITKELAKEIERVMMGPPSEEVLIRMLDLVQRELWLMWRLDLNPDLDDHWHEKVGQIAIKAGIPDHKWPLRST